jgi:membrane-bound ClpP family serine protease
MLGAILVIVGLLVWLLAAAPIIGIILIVIGLLLLFAGPYSYSYGWHGRRAPP